MKFTAHVVIERPQEKVFDWMFQPQHIVQLLTRKPTQNLMNKGPVPAHLLERVAKQQRFQEQAETAIEIEDLSTPVLCVGTTFYYRLGLKHPSIEFPEWKYLTSGTVTIKKSTVPTFFAFTTKGFSPSAEHQLVFHPQRGGTSIIYTQSIPFGKLQLKIASVLAPGVFPSGNEASFLGNGAIPFGDKEVQQQLMHLKSQMEVEIG
ncbi:hypothetical protein KDW_46680 [Dictyobacter vulcani]|uniref:Uncharacterized protein n=1 Tax=Dictyobacter vulcani TaxID=2607529 RepID=A0A5J4KZ75_9CHLR|nr:hypothetical protein [Dictyobacter vulcani]GER90506.1 hypothetical protein KDW_46680 [Dictyobacter vulcani]